MPWRGHNAKWCHGCDRHISECGPLSARYKCEECSETAMLENHRELIAGNGPHHDYWRRKTLAAFGIIMVDNARREA